MSGYDIFLEILKWFAIVSAWGIGSSSMYSIFLLFFRFDVVGFIRKKSVGNYSSFPYTAVLCNGTLASLYGYLSGGDAVLICNLPYIPLGFFYLMVFWILTKSEHDRNISLITTGCYCLVIVILTSALWYCDNDTRVFYHGIAVDCSGLIQYSAPLVKLLDIIRSKSTNGLPLPFCLATFICCSLWVVYCILTHDIFVLIMNIIGCFISAFQLSLFCIYPNTPKQVIENEINPELIDEDGRRLSTSQALLREDEYIQYYEN